ncbi:hypothetical protein AAFF_G00256070 [Aldrovandia affinis]|uniref:B30.2/SPRY domain-containing protein n=1 Tax=Aldrovandia affinis TaxID=143900 RepID=A0AAD7RC90_9TELE|nr:hypothetical protein AAFF_G00256070 [Aldrovandia affinis]
MKKTVEHVGIQWLWEYCKESQVFINHEPCGSRPGYGTEAVRSVWGGEGQWKAMWSVGPAREESGGRVKGAEGSRPGQRVRVLQQSLKELRVTLESGQEMLNNYASANFLSRFATAHVLGDQFEMLSEQLDDSYQMISLALLVDQRRTTTEATPREEDEEDQGSDRGELETLPRSQVEKMDAVQEVVDSTQIEVQKKCMLKSLKEVHIPEPRTREDFLKYSCPLTLDPNTAHRELRLSEGNRKVTWVEQIHSYPDHPERFKCKPQVLCREGLSGRCYWEVEWSGRGVDIAVSYKEINRKGGGADCVLGYNDKSWSLDCCPTSCSFWHNDEDTKLPALPSPRIGVYLDHGAGTLSFYNISDTMTHLHSVRTTFDKLLYPGFWIYCPNSSVKL